MGHCLGGGIAPAQPGPVTRAGSRATSRSAHSADPPHRISIEDRGARRSHRCLGPRRCRDRLQPEHVNDGDLDAGRRYQPGGICSGPRRARVHNDDRATEHHDNQAPCGAHHPSNDEHHAKRSHHAPNRVVIAGLRSARRVGGGFSIRRARSIRARWTRGVPVAAPHRPATCRPSTAASRVTSPEANADSRPLSGRTSDHPRPGAGVLAPPTRSARDYPKKRCSWSGTIRCPITGFYASSTAPGCADLLAVLARRRALRKSLRRPIFDSIGGPDHFLLVALL